MASTSHTENNKRKSHANIKKSELGGLTAQQHEQIMRQSSRYARECRPTTPLFGLVIGAAAILWLCIFVAIAAKADEPQCAREVREILVTYTNACGVVTNDVDPHFYSRMHRTIIKTPGGSIGIRVCASNQWPVTLLFKTPRCPEGHWHFLTTLTNSGTVLTPSRFPWMFVRFDEGPR